jgi:hypothetical protein
MKTACCDATEFLIEWRSVSVAVEDLPLAFFSTVHAFVLGCRLVAQFSSGAQRLLASCSPNAALSIGSPEAASSRPLKLKKEMSTVA